MVKRKKPAKADTQPKTLAQKVILVILALVVLAVGTMTICAIVFDTKYQVEREIENLAETYYKEYFYPGMSSGNNEMSEVLGKFSESGFAPVTLRQLILTNSNISKERADWIRKYCDQETTKVVFYPEQPWEADSYRSEISYSCNF